jgi:soluble lytic murein transglycosylase-like protein
MMTRAGGPHVPATQRLVLRGVGIFMLLVAVGGALSFVPNGARANAEDDGGLYTGTVAEFGTLRTSLDAKQGELELVNLELERAEAIIQYSGKFRIPADLTARIYDAALRSGLDPALAFEIVRIESRFNPRAVSPVGAIGLTQLMPKTAAFYDAEITREKLFDPDTNLRIGFVFFRELLTRYEGDLRLALLAYNRGPGRVGQLLARGANPDNGYDQAVLSGYRRGPTLP